MSYFGSNRKSERWARATKRFRNGWGPRNPKSARGRRKRSGRLITDMAVSTIPYWQDGGVVTALARHPLPARVDVLIVGGGYTGLSAARATACAGAATLVLEAAAIGAGCSGRNGGQVAYRIKPSYAALKSLYGETKAYAICQEGREAVAYLRRLATEQGIDCDWRERGCFFGAHTPRHFAAMVHDAQNQPRGLEQRISV